MKKITSSLLGCTLAGVLALIVTSAHADTFGSGANTFTIDFVDMGKVGNADDVGAGGGSYSSPYGGVSYTYRMGVAEAAQDWITKATNLGMANVIAGDWSAGQSATSMTWYEAAAFVNWLNDQRTPGLKAYNLNGTATAMTLWSSGDAWQAGGENLYRHKDAYYFLPSEDEWYKAAFHQNDDATANYWDYATGSNTIPTAVASGTASGTAVYSGGGAGSPANVDNDGGLSPYGTRGQNGNVFEWQESALDGTNDSSSELRGFRGGRWNSAESNLRSSFRDTLDPALSLNSLGFRVASVPEPTSALLLLCSGMMLLRRRSCASVH